MKPGDTITNPIDLTSEGHPDTMSVERMQILGDEQLARLLQQDLDRGPGDRISEDDEPDLPSTAKAPGQWQQYGDKLRALHCNNCNTQLPIGPADVTSRMKGLVVNRNGPHAYVTCRCCNMHCCSGCGNCCVNLRWVRPLEEDGAYNREAAHCEQGRLFLIFALLCGPAYAPMNGAANSKPSSGPPSSTPSTKQSCWPSWLDKSEKSPLPKGTGYGGPKGYTVERIPKGNVTNKGVGEDVLTGYYRYLSFLLPNCNRSNTSAFDDDQSGTDILNMINRSPLIIIAIDLLRNNNMEDVGKKFALYDSVLAFIGTIRSHPVTIRSLCNQTVYPRPQQLIHAAFSGQAADPTLSNTNGTLYNALKSLVKCASFYSDKANENSQHLDKSYSRGVELASRIYVLADGISRSKAFFEGKPRKALGPVSQPLDAAAAPSLMTRGQRARDAVVRQARYDEQAQAYHQEHMVEEIPDDKFFHDFYYTNAAQVLKAGSQVKGRMRKIITQLAVLREPLSFGVYVRHASSRIDAMKILIVGPQGSPYENGLFEFDLFCGGSFPNSPPDIHFKTTGSGRVHFNPNLYANGKVCLSLLGTWQGPSWNPESSTLLQTFVSIQAFIFTENPWYNEPGRDDRETKELSDQYNQDIQKETVRNAMVYWLTDRLRPSGEKAPTHRIMTSQSPSEFSKTSPSAGQSIPSPQAQSGGNTSTHAYGLFANSVPHPTSLAVLSSSPHVPNGLPNVSSGSPNAPSGLPNMPSGIPNIPHGLPGHGLPGMGYPIPYTDIFNTVPVLAPSAASGTGQTQAGARYSHIFHGILPPL